MTSTNIYNKISTSSKNQSLKRDNIFLSSKTTDNKLPNQDNSTAKNEIENTDVKISLKNNLSSEDLKLIDELKTREQEVITHENLHKRVGGQYAQAPQYSYTRGPDGKSYVTDGSVSISLSEEKNPEDTIKKMDQVKKAALAPAKPSSADLNVASEATRIAAEARAKATKEKEEETDTEKTNAKDNDSSKIKNQEEQTNQTNKLNKSETTSSDVTKNNVDNNVYVNHQLDIYTKNSPKFRRSDILNLIKGNIDNHSLSNTNSKFDMSLNAKPSHINNNNNSNAHINEHYHNSYSPHIKGTHINYFG